jgi:hypothetical protein
MYYGTPPIVTNGLVLNLDAQNPQSIPLDPTINLFNSSENIPVFPWTSNNGTRVTSSIAAPFGLGSASLYSATAGFSNVYQERTLYQGTYNLSWYIKYINQQYYSLILEGPSNGRVTFDILNGTIVAGTLAGSGTSPVIEPAPNGYYRISLSLNITTSSISLARPLLWTGVYNGNSFSGSQAYVWGAQLSRTSYATPYVSSSSTVLGNRTSWQDLSGNNNTATLLSSSISGSIPVFPAANNRVLQFDGTSSYALVSGSSTLQPSSSFTLECLFTPKNLNNGAWIVAYTGNLPGATVKYGFRINFGNVLVGYISPNPSAIAQISSNSLTIDTPIAGTLSYDGSFAKIYCNGLLINSASISGSMDYSVYGAPFFLTMGRKNTPDGAYTSENISSVRLYNRALSQAEITQNYNALKSRFGLQ